MGSTPMASSICPGRSGATALCMAGMPGSNPGRGSIMLANGEEAYQQSVKLPKGFKSPRQPNMPYKDKRKQSEFTLAVIKRRREEWFNANGPCVDCGSWNDL